MSGTWLVLASGQGPQCPSSSPRRSVARPGARKGPINYYFASLGGVPVRRTEERIVVQEERRSVVSVHPNVVPKSSLSFVPRRSSFGLVHNTGLSGGFDSPLWSSGSFVCCGCSTRTTRRPRRSTSLTAIFLRSRNSLAMLYCSLHPIGNS